MPHVTRRTRLRRDERGVAFPSPLVLLSVVAVAMAGIAFVVTGDTGESGEGDIAVVARPEADPSAKDTNDKAAAKEMDAGTQRKDRKKGKKKDGPKPIDRAEVPVVVFNNSGISGLAGRTGTKAQDIGWQVVAVDNWYGTIPASTVYFPDRLQRAARMLARDLGIDRVQPAVDPMRMDRLTVVLTADYS